MQTNLLITVENFVKKHQVTDEELHFSQYFFSCITYEGCPINKLQNSIILLIFEI